MIFSFLTLSLFSTVYYVPLILWKVSFFSWITTLIFSLTLYRLPTFIQFYIWLKDSKSDYKLKWLPILFILQLLYRSFNKSREKECFHLLALMIQPILILPTCVFLPPFLFYCSSNPIGWHKCAFKRRSFAHHFRHARQTFVKINEKVWLPLSFFVLIVTSFVFVYSDRHEKSCWKFCS